MRSVVDFYVACSASSFRTQGAVTSNYKFLYISFVGLVGAVYIQQFSMYIYKNIW